MEKPKIYPVGTLGGNVLFVDERDLPFIGKDRSLEVMCVQVDLENKQIEEPWSLERHLKFNPWEEVTTPEGRDAIMRILATKFSDIDISKKIILPLAQHRVESKAA